MKPKLIAAFLAAFSAHASAADAPAAPDAPVIILQRDLLASSDQADAWKRWAEDFSRDMRASMGTLFGARMGPHKVVKGAPYSAEVVTEVNQPLADGNVISRKKTGMVFRDGEGRTRQETAAEGKAHSVHINDPVEGKMYILSPGFKNAIVVPSVHHHVHKHEHKHKDKNKQVVRVDGTEVRIEDGKVFVNGKETSAVDAREFASRTGRKIVVRDGKVMIDGKEIASIDPGGREVVVKRLASEDGTRREEIRVQVVRPGDGLAPLPPVPPVPPTPGTPALAPLPPLPPMPGVQTMRFETAKLGKGATTSLGMKEFDGVKAEGKSTVWTIAAGEIGNRNPINVTSETWYSPDLQVTVYSRYNDPRTGETVYRLANIRRGEPSPDLFKVPEDYKTKTRGRGERGLL